ncbi:MAG TPA: alpha/beta hydrolase-fold protein [Candidatus Bathyarchaeia archaeon]|nr:alpha/beta hydrolase-fold protein [Candidatus Bathyarchaeia archaeon]
MTKQRAIDFLLAVALAAALLLAAPFAHAQGRAECATVNSAVLARSVRYCAYLPASFDTDRSRHYPVLYYLHGLGDNEQSLLNMGGWDLIEELRRSGKIGEFVVLAPGAGHTFFLNSADGKFRYEDFLLKEFMPQMEKKYRGDGSAARRGITGVSMGGFGALRLAFKYPQQFAAVSARMPALIAEIPANFSAGGPGSPGSVMGDVFGSPVNLAYFQQNNVFYFAQATPAAQLKRLKIYFDVGNNDDYGFEQGGQKLHQLLDSRGVANEFHIYPGRHDPQFVMRHFGEVMQFQWKAFGK